MKILTTAQKEAMQEGRRIAKENKTEGDRTQLDPIDKAKKNPRSFRMAITAKCWDCCGAGADPLTRVTIAECTVYHCPLWTLRPWQSLKRDKDDDNST